MSIFEPLVTDRLILRFIDSADAADVARMMTPAVARWLASWPAPMTVDMAEARIASARGWAAERKALSLAIVRAADRRFMGWIDAVRTDDGKAGLGYWLGAEFHGHGYMREAARATLDAAFDFLGVDTAIAGCQLDNAASIAVLESCGMRAAGERMHFASSRGRDEPCMFYEITRGQPVRK